MTQDKATPLSGSALYFDKVAEEYASWYHAQSPGGYVLRVRQQRLLELLDHPGGKVLDVGCGPGVLAGELLKLGYEFWGMDASPRMIERCERFFGNADRARFTVGDARSLPFPDGFFDTVICMGVIDRVPGYELAIKEMVRVVKKDGTLLISFTNIRSPYAAWKHFVFYPTVALLRPIYYRLARRSLPPSLYGFACPGQLRPLLSFLAELHTARTARALISRHSATELISRHGAEVTNAVYFYFNVFLSPLDELFSSWSLAVTRKLEWIRFGGLKWLGAGFILKARKR